MSGCLPAFAQAPADPALIQFAQDYAHAVESGNVERIKAFFDPDLFAGLSDAQKKAADGWIPDMISGSVHLTDPAWIQVQTLTQVPDPDPFHLGKIAWKIPPQYMISIQSYHTDGHGGEVGGDMQVEGVAKRAGHFYIVRPLPK